MRNLLARLRHWWDPRFDCNSRGVIDFLRACGHTAAARDVESLFRDNDLREHFKQRV